MQSLADEIINMRVENVRTLLMQGAVNINEMDEYGFTPLIEAAIVNHTELLELIIQHGADVNLPDLTGGTALHWAVENNNLAMCQILLEHRANPNAYTLAGQPALTMALLRQQDNTKRLLYRYGASLTFAQDFINAKLAGHVFELVGHVDMLAPNKHFVGVDFEGFFLEFTLGLIAESVANFKNHFIAKHWRRYASIIQKILLALLQAGKLIKYQQHLINIAEVASEITQLSQTEPLLIPVAYEGHAITFIKYGNFLAKCDRREDSRLYDNIVIYKIGKTANFNQKLLNYLLYEKLTLNFVNQTLPDILELFPVTELRITAQVSGNCSWANVEAAIPTLFFFLLQHEHQNTMPIAEMKTVALDFFHQWQVWNRDRVLQFTMQAFYAGDAVRRACKAEILATILFQAIQDERLENTGRINEILTILSLPSYAYLLKNYIRIYGYENYSEQGKKFLALLDRYGYQR